MDTYPTMTTTKITDKHSGLSKEPDNFDLLANDAYMLNSILLLGA